MTDVERVSSASPYEKLFGFCRAMRQGRFIFVAGTAPIGTDGKTVAPGNAAAQTRRCFEICRDAIEQLGGGLEHVVRTRMFLTDVDDWQAVGKVHGEFFGDAPPVATMVQVAKLIDPDWCIEVEVDALLPAD